MNKFKSILKQLGKRWFLTVVFGFDLLVLVALSEAIRSMFLGLNPNPYAIGNWVTVFAWIFVLVPLILVPLWYASPYAIKKLLVTFGLAEESVGEKTKSKKVKKESKEGTKKGYNLILSKWLYYILIATLLLIFIALTSYGASLGIEMAARFLPTFVGLFVTLVIFWIFFDIREKLEWKTTKEKIMNRIGRQLHGVFQNVSLLCEVDVQFDFEQDDYKRYDAKKLQALIAKEIMINDALEKEETSRYYAQMFQGLEDALGEIERRHGNFLSPYLQNSLINLEENLHSLSFECLLTFGNKEDRKKFIVDAVGKIMKEIDEMRKNGIDVGF